MITVDSITVQNTNIVPLNSCAETEPQCHSTQY